MGFPIATHIAHIFMVVCSFVAAMTGYFNRNKFLTLRIFYIYPLLSLIQLILLYVILNCHVSKKIRFNLIDSSNFIFLIVEFLLIYRFFVNTLASKTIEKLLYSIQLVYGLIVTFYLVTQKHLFETLENLYIFQGFCILIPVLLYLYELFKWPKADNLSTLPSFWISTGIVFYFACTLPLFLMKDFIFYKKGGVKETKLYLINYFAYGIMFLFIAKAYLCPKRDTP